MMRRFHNRELAFAGRAHTLILPFPLVPEYGIPVVQYTFAPGKNVFTAESKSLAV